MAEKIAGIQQFRENRHNLRRIQTASKQLVAPGSSVFIPDDERGAAAAVRVSIQNGERVTTVTLLERIDGELSQYQELTVYRNDGRRAVKTRRGVGRLHNFGWVEPQPLANGTPNGHPLGFKEQKNFDGILAASVAKGTIDTRPVDQKAVERQMRDADLQEAATILEQASIGNKKLDGKIRDTMYALFQKHRSKWSEKDDGESLSGHYDGYDYGNITCNAKIGRQANPTVIDVTVPLDTITGDYEPYSNDEGNTVFPHITFTIKQAGGPIFCRMVDLLGVGDTLISPPNSSSPQVATEKQKNTLDNIVTSLYNSGQTRGTDSI
jgi:hypothetical protein